MICRHDLIGTVDKMPEYTYLCDKQNIEFETSHKISEELTSCPKCLEAGKEDHIPKRLISSTSFVLVGSGWASSGYSSK
jgi:putative FmdB family regulatory protein